MNLELSDLHGTPVFLVRDRAPHLTRVYGAQFNPDKNEWYFPAYPPFGQLVVSDLAKVDKTLVWTPEATAQREYLESVPGKLKTRQTPPLEFITKPFDHQFEGLAWTYHYPRSALLWDPGTGKSKVVVDLIRLLLSEEGIGYRALIVTPKVTVLNWVEQFDVHAGGAIRVGAIIGAPEKKREVIANHRNYDVLVCSYGTARNMGLPKVLPPALKLMKEALKPIEATESTPAQPARLSESMFGNLGIQVRRISDPDVQVEMVDMKLAGATLPQVKAAIDTYLEAHPTQWLEDTEFDMIVADEGHSIGDMGSTQTKVLLTLSKKASRRVLMTGTPTEGDPLELYPQMKFLAPCLVPEDWLRYSDQFLVRAKHNKRIILGFKNLNILNARVQRIAINKRKEECLDLPPRMPPIDIVFELTPQQKSLYNTALDAMAVQLDAFFEGAQQSQLDIQNTAVLLNKLGQVSSGFLINSGQKAEICNGCEYVKECVANNILPYTPDCKVAQAPIQDVKYLKENPKLSAFEELLDNLLLNPKNKVITWANYHPEMDAIEALLKKRKVGYVRVDGSTGTKIQDLIRLFNTNPEVRVYLGQVATGVGITLNAAQYMIYYSLPWSLRQYLQSIDRNYRAGQTEKVSVWRLLGKGTVDEYKAKILDAKKDMVKLLTGSLSCVTCPKNLECLKTNTELFDPGCIHQRSVKRLVAHAEAV